MSDWLQTALLDYGPLLLGLSAFLSSLIVPIPTSWVMLAGGALAATGALSLPWLFLAGVTGAILGDQAGYVSGVALHDRVVSLSQRNRRSQQLYQKAHDLAETRGWLGVFLSRWLFSPLGPYVNIISGAADMTCARFTLWASLGKVFWVGLYCGLGFVFADNLPEVTRKMGKLTWVLTALILVALAVALYWTKRRKT